MKILEHDIHSSIALIYECAINPDRWPELLETLADLVDKSPESAIAIGENHSLAAGSEAINDILAYHFKNALTVSQQFINYEGQQETVGSLLDHLPIPLVVCDDTAAIIECNNRARLLITSGPTLYINDRNQQLCARDPELNAKLSRYIQLTSAMAPNSGQGKTLQMPVTSSEDSLLLIFSPIKGGPEGKSKVAIFIAPPKAQPVPAPATLGKLYDLSDREMEVAVLLARGFTPNEIAEHNDVSVDTVRTQLRSLFRKTGSKRQADLVRLVLTAPDSSLASGIRELNDEPVRFSHVSHRRVHYVTLSHGRRIAYREFGDPKGAPLVFHHSALGSDIEIGQLAHGYCLRNNIRLIAPNRPGFGSSDPDPDFEHATWASDMTEFVTALQLDNFYVAGYAMGGQFACAMAESLPQRTKGLLLISSSIAATRPEDFERMVPLYRMDLRLARNLPAVHNLTTAILYKGITRNPTRFFKNLQSQSSERESKLFASERFREFIWCALMEGVAQGNSRHIARECQLLMRPWTFSPENICAPTWHWHGAADNHVPLSLGRQFADKIPGCRFVPVADHGHYMIYEKLEQILDDFIKETCTDMTDQGPRQTNTCTS
ncbi:MAG: alpha/beta fold hydrolase [Gammaproteobacteria bacterium]|nr:alpha/beta fold hydrolase [Gammaproteobacteria bacterium]